MASQGDAFRLLRSQLASIDVVAIPKRELLAYLDDVVRRIEVGEPFTESDHHRLAEIRNQMQANELALWRGRVEDQRQTFQDFNQHQINMSLNALRVSLLVNGGAAVAALAFVGQARGELSLAQMNGSLSALETFCLGVVAAAVASGVAYIVQFFRTLAVNRFHQAQDSDFEAARAPSQAPAAADGADRPDPPKTRDAYEAEARDARRRGGRHDRAGDLLTAVAAVLVIGSYFTFIAGAYRAAEALRPATDPAPSVRAKE